MSENSSRKPTVSRAGEGRKLTVLGQKITVKLGSAETGGNCFLFENTAPPGSSVPPHVHSREDEILQVLDGELEVTLDGKTFKASAGTVAFFPRHVVHGFGNVGNVPASTRFLVSPGASFEQFFCALNELPADQPPDMAKVVEIFERYGISIVGAPGSR